MQAASDQYAACHPGTTISWSFRPLSDFNDQPLASLAAAGDLLVVDHPFVGTAARSASIVPFGGIDEERLTQIGGQAIGSTFASYVSEGRVWALPVDAACQVAAWRPDLLPDPPRTWSDTIRLARQRPRSVVLPLYPTDTICSLISLSGSSRVTLTAIEHLQALVPHLHPASFAMNPPAALDAMTGGDEIAYAPLVFGYSDYARAGLERRLAFTAAPTGAPTILGGAGVAVSAASSARAAAIDVALWLSGPSGQRLVARAGGQPSDRQAWKEAASGPRGAFFSGTLAAVESAFVRETSAGWPRFQEQAGVLATALLQKGAAAGRIHAELDQLAASMLP